MRSVPSLPIHESSDSIRGFKFADVRGKDEPHIHPSGRFWRRMYEHREPTRAECHRRNHAAPEVDCTCGFHAVTNLHELPAITEHHSRSVVLEVEFGGTVIEHDHGMRGEQQTVLAVLFPSTCGRCGAPATALRRGRLWRSSCDACARREPAKAVSRADATALFGVEIGFQDVTPTRTPGRSMHLLRACSMVALMTVCAIAAFRAEAAGWVPVVISASVLATLALALGVARAGSPRARESLFQVQCLCLTACSILLLATTHPA